MQELGTEGQEISEEYFLVSGGITLGTGFKWDLSSDVTFAAEFTTRRVFTDYLDDVSTTYADRATIAAVRVQLQLLFLIGRLSMELVLKADNVEIAVTTIDILF